MSVRLEEFVVRCTIRVARADCGRRQRYAVKHADSVVGPAGRHSWAVVRPDRWLHSTGQSGW